MKPPPIRYARPDSLDQALVLLAEHEDAKCLAGGQSLMPILNLRLASSASLVDLSRVGLDSIRVDGDQLVIGAMATHRAIERSAVVAKAEPLVARAAREIGHLAIRSRGTIGGSLAHADPAAEWPLLAVALGARLRVRSRGGERQIAAADFFTGPLSTALAPGEIVVEVRFPVAPAASAFGFRELCRRPGDFAIVAVACRVTRDAGGFCRAVALGVAGANPVPLRLAEAERCLVGSSGDASAIRAAAEAAAAAVDPGGDLHGSADYRRRMVRVLARRAIEDAISGGRA